MEARGWLELVPTNKKEMILFYRKEQYHKQKTEDCAEPGISPLENKNNCES